MPQRRCAITLGIRKLRVIAIIGGVFLTANIMIVAFWLQDHDQQTPGGGGRNPENFKTAIDFHCGGLDLYPR